LATEIKDLAGNSATSPSVSVIKDTVAPSSVAFSTSLATALINRTNQSAFPVSGTCSENGASNVVVKAGPNPVGSPLNCVSGEFTGSLNLSGISDQTITFSLEHSDPAGNTVSSTPVRITKDTTSPTAVAFTASFDGAYVNANTQNAFTISGTCSESDTATISIRSGSTTLGSPVTCNAGKFSTTLNLSSFSDSSIPLTAVFTDTSGNSITSAEIRIIKKVLPPSSVSITSPADGSTIGTTTKITGFMQELES
jgi:hypothetical protein